MDVLQEEILELRKLCEKEISDTNKELDKERSHMNLIKRGSLNLKLLKFDECEKDFAEALNLFNATFFLDKNYYDLESKVYYVISQARTKRINVLEYFIKKEIIEESFLTNLRWQIIK